MRPGVEHGKLKHVPSTGDLLSAHVAVPPSIAAEARRAASDLGTALQVGAYILPLHIRSLELCRGETGALTARLPVLYQDAGAPGLPPHAMCSVNVTFTC